MNFRAISFVLGLLVLSTLVSATQDKTEAFVCPILNGNAGAHNPNAFPIYDGDYSLTPSGTVHIIYVPIHATNMNGLGQLYGPHASPGDPEYTAICAINDY